MCQLAQQQQAQQGGAGTAAAGGGAMGGLNFEALRNTPEIQQIRERLRENPDQVQPLVQELATRNPGIAQVLSQNPQLLLQLLGEDAADVEMFDGDGPIPPDAQIIRVTEEERAAIERVGFILTL
jgi:UV excision repair protein RAD23